MESEHSGALYCSIVSWLSTRKVLRIVSDLQEEILIFFDMKITNIEFEELMADDTFRNDVFWYKFLTSKMSSIWHFRIKMCW